MSRARRLPIVGVAFVLLPALVEVPFLVRAVDADAARLKAAFVVMDTGAHVQRARIHFRTTIDGYQALHLAGGETLRAGDTVCQILGVGTDADACGPETPRAWSYFRAEAGSTRWRSVDASPAASRLRDGDVEGWRYRSTHPPRMAPDKARRAKSS